MEPGDVTLEDGSVLPEPSDSEPSPADPVVLPLTPPPPFSVFQDSDDPRFAVQSVSTLPDIPTSKRPGGPLDTSSNKEAQATQEIEEAKMAVIPEDFGLPP